jgi:hypothetical protein
MTMPTTYLYLPYTYNQQDAIREFERIYGVLPRMIEEVDGGYKVGPVSPTSSTTHTYDKFSTDEALEDEQSAAAVIW